MDAILLMGQIIKKTAAIDPLGCAKLVVFANARRTTRSWPAPSTAPASPRPSSTSASPGPGVVRAVLSQMDDADLGELSETIKRTAFKITRVGELVGREVAERLDVAFGIVDLSLAPTPAEGDSVADILEAMGLEVRHPGTTAALALLNDAVKKGGAMATSSRAASRAPSSRSARTRA